MSTTNVRSSAAPVVPTNTLCAGGLQTQRRQLIHRVAEGAGRRPHPVFNSADTARRPEHHLRLRRVGVHV
ncbi:MAG: hypothetical protein JOY82_09510 [Streptosporangiaceae bacterium]|nr:hypothetical protein [Streptosporangiaceae bacterium]MBV9854749.1 hypothetical protein [Streptosporangiaceae bacterium]